MKKRVFSLLFVLLFLFAFSLPLHAAAYESDLLSEAVCEKRRQGHLACACKADDGAHRRRIFFGQNAHSDNRFLSGAQKFRG